MQLDALIDAIATLTSTRPSPARRAAAPARRQPAGTKPFFIEGLNSETGEWETPVANARYGEFQAGVQMANRNGALNEIEFSEFVQKLEAFAQAIGAASDLPDMLDVWRAPASSTRSRASTTRSWWRCCAHAVAWSVGYLQQAAQRHGFVPGAVPGRLVFPRAEEGAPPVLVLGFDAQAALADDPGQAAVRELTLGLDVAQTEARPSRSPRGRRPRRARRRPRRRDRRRPGPAADAAGFSAIHAELGRLYEALTAHDLAAGSPGARRLFS